LLLVKCYHVTFEQGQFSKRSFTAVQIRCRNPDLWGFEKIEFATRPPESPRTSETY